MKGLRGILRMNATVKDEQFKKKAEIAKRLIINVRHFSRDVLRLLDYALATAPLLAMPPTLLYTSIKYPLFLYHKTESFSSLLHFSLILLSLSSFFLLFTPSFTLSFSVRFTVGVCHTLQHHCHFAHRLHFVPSSLLPSFSQSLFVIAPSCNPISPSLSSSPWRFSSS